MGRAEDSLFHLPPDDLDQFITEQMKDPAFRAAFLRIARKHALDNRREQKEQDENQVDIWWLSHVHKFEFGEPCIC